MAGVEVVPEIIKKEKKQMIGESKFRSYQIAGGKMTSLIGSLFCLLCYQIYCIHQNQDVHLAQCSGKSSLIQTPIK